jgi:dephospho-CoA kinase
MESHPRPQQDKRLVVGVAGRIGAGKTSVAKYLNTLQGFQYLRYSQVLSDWLANDPWRKAHLQDVGWEVMSGGLQAELNRRLIAQIEPDADVVVDGLRHPLDYESLKSSFLFSFRLLYIDSTQNARWARLKANGRYADAASFQVADAHPVEEKIELLRPRASSVIQNSGSLDDLYIAIDKAIKKFKSGDQS